MNKLKGGEVGENEGPNRGEGRKKARGGGGEGREEEVMRRRMNRENTKGSFET